MLMNEVEICGRVKERESERGEDVQPQQVTAGVKQIVRVT